MDVVNYALSNKIKKYVDESVGNVPDEKITEAVNTYLDENPVTPGATSEQAAQIQNNTNKIDELKGDMVTIANGEDIVKKTQITLSMGAIHNTGANPSKPAISSNTAYSQYINNDCDIYFDSTKYKLLVIPYDSNDVWKPYGAWVTSSPVSLKISDDTPHYAIELRRVDNAGFTISEIEFPYIKDIKKNIPMHTANDAKEKSEMALRELANFSKKEDSTLYGKTKKSISGIVTRRYKPFRLADLSELPLKDLLWDGFSFLPIMKDNYDFSSSTIYASCDGNGDGATKDNPTSLDNAMVMAKKTQYSSIILQRGIYIIPSQISWYDLSAKLVCEDGKAIFVASSKNYNAWADVADKLCKYETISGEISKVFERINDDYVMLREVESVDDCNITFGSYYIDSANNHIYVNAIFDFGNIIVTEKIGGSIVLARVASSDKSCNINCKNVDFIGGTSCFKANANGYGKFENCSFIGSYGYGNNCFFMTGEYKSVCIKCICKYSGSDGFNYHGNARFVEIDCVSGCHGYDSDSRSNSNASTSHETVKGFRIGGIYYDTNGPVIADVGEAITVNSNCVAIESNSVTGNGGFIVDTATMYCFGCFTNMTGHGGYAQASGGIVYSRNCDFDGDCNDTQIVD